MRLKLNIRKELKIAALLLAMGCLIGFEGKKTDDIVIQDVTVQLENVGGNHYLDEDDVLRLIGLKKENMKGAALSYVSMKEMENKIKKSPYVSDAQLFVDLKGHLAVNVTLRRPAARLTTAVGPEAYVAEDGSIMPVSSKYSSRVLVISGAMVPTLIKQQNLRDTDFGDSLMDLIGEVNDNDFWRAQIAQVNINKSAELTIYPQVGGEHFEFGKLEDVDGKLEKLMIYYKEILPRMGWNKYSRVSLQFQDQIVAE